MMFTIGHVDIITGHDVIEDGMVVVENGRIVAVEPATPSAPAPTYHASGLTLAAGMIDLQLNGGFGHDFTADPASIWPVAAQLPQFGVTSFLPTLVSCPLETVAVAQKILAARPPGFKGATPLGLHVEGPFLNPKKKGAHQRDFLRLPDEAAIAGWCPEEGIRLVTVAPELPKAHALIKRLVSQGVVVSAGHSMATLKEARDGFEAGIRYGTHLFNAMPPIHHREPGLAAALLHDDRLVVGLISDGIHVHPAVVALVWQVVGNGRLTLVTDGMAAMGMQSGVYQLANRTVQVDGDRSVLPDGTLAGAVVSMDRALQKLVAFTSCRLEDALLTVTQIPARLLGEKSLGQVTVGCQADLVLLSKTCQVQATFINGELVFGNVGP